jgi:hypothetical protein
MKKHDRSVIRRHDNGIHITVEVHSGGSIMYQSHFTSLDHAIDFAIDRGQVTENLLAPEERKKWWKIWK